MAHLAVELDPRLHLSSLGGRSAKRLLTYRNLLVTMLAGGLWHGAAWTFVGWGGLHGLGLIVNRAFRHRFPQGSSASAARRIIGWCLTINFVCLAWILFRAANFPVALTMLQRYLLLGHGGPESLPLWLAALGPTLLLLQYFARRFAWLDKIAGLGERPFAIAYGGAWAFAVALVPLGYRPFIYFQF